MHAPALAKRRQSEVAPIHFERRFLKFEIDALVARHSNGGVHNEGALWRKRDDILQVLLRGVDHLRRSALFSGHDPLDLLSKRAFMARPCFYGALMAPLMTRQAPCTMLCFAQD